MLDFEPLQLNTWVSKRVTNIPLITGPGASLAKSSIIFIVVFHYISELHRELIVIRWKTIGSPSSNENLNARLY